MAAIPTTFWMKNIIMGALGENGLPVIRAPYWSFGFTRCASFCAL
jgi:hypothetical protein